jgi:hypothetical protein
MTTAQANQQFSFPSQPEKLFLKFALISCGALVLGTIIPALVANHTDVFYQSTMITRIIRLSLGNSSLDPIRQAMAKEEAYRQELQTVDSALAKAAAHPDDVVDVQRLVNLRSVIQADLDKEEHKFSVNPLFLNDLMLAWSGMYVCFGTLAFVLRPEPSESNKISSWSLSVALVVVYLLYQCPVWIRNFVLTSEGRRVFSFANRDISVAGFYMQEANTVLWFVLLFIVLRHWLTFYADRRIHLERERQEPISIQNLNILTDTFIQWQVSSTILALGFVIFTGVFWDLVIVSGDRRYLFPAVVMHTLWAFSWWVVSLPLLITWQDFSRKKTEALLGEAGHHSPTEGEDTYRSLENLSPISFWNGVGSVLTGILSFIFPILHALLK